MAKRKKRGQNLSIHQFDEATQKQIQETMDQERNSRGEGLILSSVQLVEDHFSVKQKDDDINDRDTDEVMPKIDDPDDDEDNILSKKVRATAQPEISEPSGTPELNLGTKFDQVSIELEQAVIIEKKQDYTLINKLFKFLDKPAASEDPNEGLNSTLCGYFSKVV